jgi:hypothetical protein
MTATVKEKTGAVNSPAVYDAGNSSTAITLNFDNGPVQQVTMTGNCTFTLTNPTAGETYLLKLLQDATGTRTGTWPAAVKWPASTAPTLSGANKVDIVSLFYDGTNYYASSTLNH